MVALVTKVQKKIPTHQKGSLPIDGIFTSRTIAVHKAGYLEFGAIKSDHRILWIKVHPNCLLGFKPPKIFHFTARSLQCTIPTVQDLWKKLYKERLRQHNLIQRQFWLENSIGDTITQDQIKEYEEILWIRHQCLIYADKHCRMIRRGQVEYSPTIKIDRLRIELWQGVIKKKKGLKFSSRKIRRLAKQVGETEVLDITLEEAMGREEAAQVVYWKHKKQSATLRKTFLQTQAEELARKKNQSTTNIYKQIIQREKQRDSARQIKYALKKVKEGNVTTIETEKFGRTIELSSQHDIEQALIKENQEKYSQTNATISMKEPLLSLLGPVGDSDFAQQILNGTAQFPVSVPQSSIKFFNELKRDDRIAGLQVAPYVSVKDYQDGWKKMDEHTTAGKSGRHFGHMKTCAEDDLLSNFESCTVQDTHQAAGRRAQSL